MNDSTLNLLDYNYIRTLIKSGVKDRNKESLDEALRLVGALVDFPEELMEELTHQYNKAFAEVSNDDLDCVHVALLNETGNTYDGGLDGKYIEFWCTNPFMNVTIDQFKRKDTLIVNRVEVPSSKWFWGDDCNVDGTLIELCIDEKYVKSFFGNFLSDKGDIK